MTWRLGMGYVLDDEGRQRLVSGPSSDWYDGRIDRKDHVNP